MKNEAETGAIRGYRKLPCFFQVNGWFKTGLEGLCRGYGFKCGSFKGV